MIALGVRCAPPSLGKPSGPSTGRNGVGQSFQVRTERLFQIIQIPRSTRAPVTGRDLADELEVSFSTLYRDMAELHAQRIPITGEAGVGYVLDASSKAIQTRATVSERFDSALLRHAIRRRCRLQMVYTDRDGATTERVVWPLLIAFLDRTRCLVGWCETKQDYRHIKTERIGELKVIAQTYPGRRAALLKGWEEATARRR